VYEIRDNVGSVRLAINGAKVNSQADIAQYNDYYPYGSIAQSGGTGYRYAYQGAYAESDPVTGYNNFELRMYDSRIARWLSVDPGYQYASPYEGMGNNPVMRRDPTGGQILLSKMMLRIKLPQEPVILRIMLLFLVPGLINQLFELTLIKHRNIRLTRIMIVRHPQPEHILTTMPLQPVLVLRDLISLRMRGLL